MFCQPFVFVQWHTVQLQCVNVMTPTVLIKWCWMMWKGDFAEKVSTSQTGIQGPQHKNNNISSQFGHFANEVTQPLSHIVCWWQWWRCRLQIPLNLTAFVCRLRGTAAQLGFFCGPDCKCQKVATSVFKERASVPSDSLLVADSTQTRSVPAWVRVRGLSLTCSVIIITWPRWPRDPPHRQWCHRTRYQ